MVDDVEFSVSSSSTLPSVLMLGPFMLSLAVFNCRSQRIDPALLGPLDRIIEQQNEAHARLDRLQRIASGDALPRSSPTTNGMPSPTAGSSPAFIDEERTKAAALVTAETPRSEVYEKTIAHGKPGV